MDPVVLEFSPPPRPPFWSRLHRFGLGPRSAKVITVLAAVTISLSIVGFAIFTTLANNATFKQTHGLTVPGENPPAQSSGGSTDPAGLPGAGPAVGVGGTTGSNSPVVTLTATPASVGVGGASTLKWTVTNNPTSCVASDDWSGGKAPAGTEKTPALKTAQTYLFTLTCKNATGTGFATVPVAVVAQGGTGTVGLRPAVHLAANPAAIYAGDSSTLNWTVDGDPTSCSASGDWVGSTAESGSQGTGPLTAAKSYSYTLTCKNASGTGFATATVLVTEPPAGLPIVAIASNPTGPVAPGAAVTLSWSATNSPTSCSASGDWSGNKPASGSQGSIVLASIRTYTFTLTCSNSSGSTFDSAAVAVIPARPVVSLTVSPNTLFVGGSSTISWSATNSPTSCTASGDWSGSKAASGSVSTGVLSSAKTYLYNLTCSNAGGSGFVNNVSLVVTVPPAPQVTLSANPIQVTAGSSSSLSWSATNSPTSCTASGDWSGSKAASGAQSTGALSSVRTYTYSLSCANAGGSGSATTTVNVSSGAPPVAKPVVTIAVTPASIGTGSSSTISWSATNSPTSCTASGSWSGSQAGSGSVSTGVIATAGSRTYTLSCSNSAGAGSASAVLTVIAVPVVTISVSPASINTGGSSTITWSATNSPTSCTAGGSWSGSKAASGSVTTGVISSAGSYVYTLSCTNAGGTTSASATLTAANAAPVYCGGNTPCYGPNDLVTYSSPGNCWAWNLTWVINITNFRPAHPGGIKSGSTSTIENSAAVCDHNINAILAGSAAIPGYKDASGSTTHGHKSATTNNSGSSALLSYRVGYYDANKP